MAESGQVDLALIVAAGDVPLLDELDPSLLGRDDEARLVIAADGGLRQAQKIGLRPTLVVGDGDSLGPEVLTELAGSGIEVRLHPRDKDASDTELALREALARGARRVVVLGALGGLRFDHSLANLLLLALPELADVEVALVDGRTTVRVLHGPQGLDLRGAAGEFVSLFALSDEVSGVRTSRLRFALDGATLAQGPSRGLSNEMTGAAARVEIATGRLAVIHTRGTAE